MAEHAPFKAIIDLLEVETNKVRCASGQRNGHPPLSRAAAPCRRTLSTPPPPPHTHQRPHSRTTSP